MTNNIEKKTKDINTYTFEKIDTNSQIKTILLREILKLDEKDIREISDIIQNITEKDIDEINEIENITEEDDAVLNKSDIEEIGDFIQEVNGAVHSNALKKLLESTLQLNRILNIDTNEQVSSNWEVIACCIELVDVFCITTVESIIMGGTIIAIELIF